MSSGCHLRPFGEGHKTWYNNFSEEDFLEPILSITIFELLPKKVNPHICGKDFLIYYDSQGYKTIDVFLKKNIHPESWVNVQEVMIEKNAEIWGEIVYLDFDYKELLNRIVKDYKNEINKAGEVIKEIKQRQHSPWVYEALRGIGEPYEKMVETLEKLKTGKLTRSTDIKIWG